MKYDTGIIECSNKRLQVWVFNGDTDEEIKIDETYEDVKKLYQVLKDYFENGVKK